MTNIIIVEVTESSKTKISVIYSFGTEDELTISSICR